MLTFGQSCWKENMHDEDMNVNYRHIAIATISLQLLKHGFLCLHIVCIEEEFSMVRFFAED